MLVNPLVLLYFVVVLLLFVAVPPPGPGSAVGPAGHRWAPGLTWGLSSEIWNFSMKTLFIYYLIFLRQELKHRWILISFIYLGLIKVCLEPSILVFCRSLKVFWECYQSILISKHSNSYILSAFIKCSACIFPKKNILRASESESHSKHFILFSPSLYLVLAELSMSDSVKKITAGTVTRLTTNQMLVWGLGDQLEASI